VVGVQQDHRGLKDQRDHKGLKDHRVHRDQRVKETLDLPEILVLTSLVPRCRMTT
tara:strand:+ start:533 stop:697 length:165 start_codon:yes stop_codon:yes gene_type:complete